ncbi:MAG: hypothetical protein EBR67_10895 [Proteobacteria bacterium]|nr:hypothetical protein [Pseudomonadota bacterium]
MIWICFFEIFLLDLRSKKERKTKMDKVRKLELDNYWGSDIHTDDVELKNAIKKLDAIIKKGQTK